MFNILAFGFSIISLYAFFTVCVTTFNKFATRLARDVFINLELSINLSYYVTSILFLISFFSVTENVIYFSVFSPKPSIVPSNFANSLIIK